MSNVIIIPTGKMRSHMDQMTYAATPQSRQAERDEIERLTEEYQAKGGVIERLRYLVPRDGKSMRVELF